MGLQHKFSLTNTFLSNGGGFGNQAKKGSIIQKEDQSPGVGSRNSVGQDDDQKSDLL